MLFRRFSEYDGQRPFLAWALGVAQFEIFVTKETAGTMSTRIAATFVSMDPKREDEVFCHMTVWKVDLDRGTREPTSTMWRATQPNMVSAAYDQENLYVACRVQSPAKLVNAIPDPQIIFKGGNLIDIQIATHPGLDPKRQEPGPGDVRLLVIWQPCLRESCSCRP